MAVAACALFSVSAWASPLDDAQMAELDRARSKIANEVQLSAYDLVDELVYGWMSEPTFDKPTPVVLASVTVPVGLGTGLQALVENHIAAVLAENPTTNIQMVHCPTCSAVVVHSGPKGTVVSRGFDNPDVLEELGTDNGQHALFVDIEAEGSWLVLRARLTRLTPELPIVWSKTLTTSAGTPALLREATDLKSAAEARKDYIDALHSRGRISVPVRFVSRSYARSFDSTTVPPPPFIWLQSGVEIGVTDARAWTSSLLVGYSFVPQAYQGLMAQARVNRLITGRVRSLTRPDLYLFAGGAVMTVWGVGTASFQDEPLTADDIAVILTGDDPRTNFGGIHFGLDLRVGQRIGFSTFLETLPSMANNRNLGQYLRIAVAFQSLGTEVTIWF